MIRSSIRTLGSREARYAAIFLLIVVFLFGGASRSDVIGHAVVRAIAILSLGWSLIRMDWRDNGALRVPIALMLGWIALIGVQLIPLPPGFWANLPARANFVDLFQAAGVSDAWRPLSLSPNATINALFAVLVPLAVLIALTRIEPKQWSEIVAALLCLAAISAFLGIVQITSQAPWAYLYRITNEGAAVGLFANRNHQALLMAATFPLLGLAAAWPTESPQRRSFYRFIAVGGSVLLVPLILITGSRAGLVLMVIGALGGWLIYRSGTAPPKPLTKDAVRRERQGMRARWLPLSLTAILVALVGITVVLSRAEAVQRLFSEDVSQEIRVRLFSTMLRIGNDFAPWGAGFGTFDPMFRMYEPFDNLSPLYVNHAHNDLLEIYIEGGVPALVLMTIFLVWLGLRGVAAWRQTSGKVPPEQLIARGGSVVLLMQLVASLADYPLRTPAHAALAATACAMVAAWPVRRRNF